VAGLVSVDSIAYLKNSMMDECTVMAINQHRSFRTKYFLTYKTKIKCDKTTKITHMDTYLINPNYALSATQSI